ncbi:unnamed protein product [Oncorhynchus mykiss]|uniref:Peptidase C19 ubiquitin carboxyl-terminal hydrolase domain-containing protein n=1 Tax=Oncorhynchus mykiss TaxID=8022 RepID=A0A060Z785_ONCMY|nr:unnamed protein product [Oncorhynchus mykiss]
MCGAPPLSAEGGGYGIKGLTRAIHLPREAVRIQAEDFPYLHQPSALECACRVCSGSMASVTSHFLTMPRVLMLHIKRFTAGNWEPEKVDDPMSIPAELTLPALCGETAPVQHGARASSLGKNNMDNTSANSPKGTLDKPGRTLCY